MTGDETPVLLLLLIVAKRVQKTVQVLQALWPLHEISIRTERGENRKRDRWQLKEMLDSAGVGGGGVAAARRRIDRT